MKPLWPRVMNGSRGREDQAYVGFVGENAVVSWGSAIGFTDMFFEYLVPGGLGVHGALIATILNTHRMDRAEEVREQGKYPWNCFIPPI